MRKHRILVVEDEAIIGMHIKSTLGRFGYEVLGVAASAKEAITMARELEPDLLLMDIVMPGSMDGIEAAAAIRGTLDLPIVYLTGNADISTVARARETNPYGYVLKPVNPQDLFSTIDTALHRHELEKKLRDSEEMLRKLTDNMRDMVGQMDRDSRIIYASPSHRKIAGYDPEELMGTSPMDLVHPDDRDALWKAFCSGVSDHVDIRTEYRGRHKDGHYLWLETVHSYIYTPEGEFDGAVFSSRDITERKKVEALHRESEERYNALFSRSHDCVYVHDFTGKFIDANEAALKLFGYSKDEVKQIDFQSILSEDQLPAAMEAMKEIFSVGFQKEKREFRIRTKKNEIRNIEVLGMLLYRDGRPDAILGIGRDITERRQTEQALRDSEAKYRLIANMMSDVVWTVNMEFRYTYMSPSCEKVFGYMSEEITGRNAAEIRGPEEFSRLLKLFEEEMRLEAAGRADPDRHIMLEHMAIHKDGRQVWLESVVRAIRDSNGGIIGLHGVSRDISKRRQAEEALVVSEEKYRALVESTDTGYVIVDPAGCVLDANSEYVRLTGHANIADIRGRSVLEWTAVHHRVKNEEAVRRCFEQGFIRSLEIDYVDGSGKITPIEVNATVAGSGPDSRIHTLCRDISRRRAAEDELLKSKEQFRALFERSSAGIFIYDRDMTVTDCNQQFADILKTKRENLLGLNLNLLRETHIARSLVEALEGKLSVYKGPYRATTTGAVPWISSSVSPLCDAKGEIVGGLGIVVDITDMITAQEAVREREERFRAVFDQSPVGIFTYSHDMVLTNSNARFATILETTIEKLIGLDLTQLKEKAVIPVLEEAIRGGVSYYEGPYHATTSNAFRWVRFSVSPLRGPDGAVTAGIGVVVDISDRKKAEEALRESEERIRASLAEKETLLREVHHRVKNNFQVITSLMSLQSARINNPDLRKGFIDAQNRIRSMSLIHEKLYQSDDLSHLDISSYVNTIVYELYSSFADGNRKIVPRVDIADIRLTVDQAIPCGLIINELLMNSFKHAFPAGWKGDPEVLVSIRVSGGTVEMIISDNGIGLPESVNLNTPETLGLSLVPMLVRQLGGTIVLDRLSGTRMIITFSVK